MDEDELRKFDVREGGYDRHEIDVGDVYPHFGTEESISPWPRSPRGVGDADETASFPSFEKHSLGGVRCDECRLVFEKAMEKRRRSSSSGCGREQSRDLAVWVYIPSVDLPPDRMYPIPQTYVDIIMRGCLSISTDFARRFLETTRGWWNEGHNPKKTELGATTTADLESNEMEQTSDKNDRIRHHTWVNDRHAPMYLRADRQYSFEMGDEIDKLIEEHHPHALQQRVMSA